MDSEDRGEQAPTETEAARAPRTISLEAVETEDGRFVVPAEGSVWQFYFPAGLTPTEEQFRVAVGPLAAIKTMQACGIAFTGWDSSVDGVTTDIVNFTGASIIDAAARADCVKNAERADAFNERVLAEAERLVAEKTVELEMQANEKVQAFEQASIDAEQRARSAEADRDAARGEVSVARAELESISGKHDVLWGLALDAGVTEEAFLDAQQKSVLHEPDTAVIVEDVKGELIPNVEYTDTVHREERKA